MNSRGFTESRKVEEDVGKELIKRVRDLIGPIAAMKICLPVSALPRTRSGKTARKSLADLARNKPFKVSLKKILRILILTSKSYSDCFFWQIPSTIEDPTVYKEIKSALQKVGYAKTAPDPQ